MKRTVLILTFAPLALGGCASMSGVGGSNSYACKAPEGVLCNSMSGVYANSLENNLPSQRGPQKGPGAEAAPGTGGSMNDTPQTGGGRTASYRPKVTPLRSEARILRIWMAPWKDEDGDLHDESRTYVVVDDGRWLIERQRQAIKAKYSANAANAGATRE